METTHHSREGYWTPLEKQGRDLLFRPLTFLFKPFPFAANAITLIGFGILIVGIFDFVTTHNYEHQIWFLTVAWLTDLIDGPIARNNGHVTAFGIAGDHIRDYAISAWMLILAAFVTIEHPEYWIVKWILLILIIGLVGITTGAMLFQHQQRKKHPYMSYIHFLSRFLQYDLITTLTARVQTVLIAFAGIFYIAGAAWGAEWSRLGIILLLFQVFVLGFYNHEVHSARYEHRAYQMRLKLEKRARRLEHRLSKMRRVLKKDIEKI